MINYPQRHPSPWEYSVLFLSAYFPKSPHYLNQKLSFLLKSYLLMKWNNKVYYITMKQLPCCVLFSLGVSAMTCINELLSKNCVPVEFEEFLLKLFQQTFQLLQRITKDTGAQAVENLLTEQDER